MKKETILLFGDTHFPYHHADTFDFLKAVKKKYKPNKVIHLGDMVDNHAISYHENIPELSSADDELEHSILLVQELADIFPKMTILVGNHDKLPTRKARTFGLPSRYIKNNSEVFEMPDTWGWKIEEKFVMVDGRELWMRHNLKKDALEVAKYYNCCYIQGHYHEDLICESIQDKKYNIFGATIGCLVDDKSLAMEYNKGNMKRPHLGCMVIVQGQPKIIKMIVDKDNNWIGELE